MTRTRLFAIVMLIVFTGLCIWSIKLTDPPGALPTNAPITAFSSTRALVHVKNIAKEPHSMGTAAHARVRAYLIEQLKLTGVQTEVQEAIVSQWNYPASKAFVYNIIGNIKGSDPASGAVLLMAHYDSQPNTYGAADDGAGIAALLETARALKSSPQLKNDVILLLADGEEYGSFGASAFLKHPLASRVKTVVNVEARGNSGPAVTFEMNTQNGWMVEQFAQSVPYPLASSLFYEVYKVMPNYTDFSIFKSNGYTGINSAFMHGFVHYHKLTDSYEHLNVNSLQQQGSNLLALARHLGNISLQKTKSADKVFFNPAGHWMVQYPVVLNTFWIILGGGLLAASVMLGARNKMITFKYSVLGFLAYILTIALIVGAGFGLNVLFNSQMTYHHASNGVYATSSFYLCFLLTSVALYCIINPIAFRYMNMYSRLTGVYVFIYIISLIQFFILPSTAYLLIIPLIFCLSSTLTVFLFKTYFTQNVGHQVLTMAGLLPGIFMLIPLSTFLFAAFELQLPVAAQVIVLLMAGLSLPVLEFVEKNTRWKKVPVFPVLCLLVAFATASYALNENKPTDDNPLSGQMAYYLNADSGKAYCATNAGFLDDWHKQFFKTARIGKLTGIYPASTREQLISEAIVINDLPPIAHLISSTEDSAVRRICIQLTSPRQAAQFELMLTCEKPGAIRAAAINGEPIPLNYTGVGKNSLIFVPVYGLPVSKQLDLSVDLEPASKLQLRLCDKSVGLPANFIKQKRPDWIIPEQGNFSNITTILKTYNF